MSQDLRRAARLLQSVLEIDADSAARCTAYYADKVTMDPEHVREAMGLHELIAGGDQGNTLITLLQCFDLQGVEALEVYKRLRRRQQTR